MKIGAFFLLISAAVFVSDPLHAADRVIAHEWGTFTCLQDKNGEAIGGINVDDEPVPYFVQQVAVGVASQYDSPRGWHNLGLPPYEEDKGWISGDPSVTMRLETPVLYLYPPPGHAPASVPPLDVHVEFYGGVLSQFYPHATFSGLSLLRFPGQPQDNIFPYIDKEKGLTEQTRTSLDWRGVQLGSSAAPIETEDKVWTTPREVSAPLLEVKSTEPDNKGVLQPYTQAEHFLFYRGVGHLDSPIKVRNEAIMSGAEFDPFKGWMTEIRPDGSCAFRQVTEQVKLVSIGALYSPRLPASFDESDFSTANLDALKACMQAALQDAGLYPDEASAMLRTWELSYFKSPGLRFFYLAPRVWVDKVLPLTVAGAPVEITRVMVGRIEFETDGQRAALQRLAAGPCPDLVAVKKAAQEALQKSSLPKADIEAFYRGEKPLTDLGIPIPPLVQDYLMLGRFRDALIVHEQQQRPSFALAQFIKDNRLLPSGN